MDGSSASHGIIPELFNKKIIINQVDHLALTFSTDVNNFLLFKKYIRKTNNLMKKNYLKNKLMSFEDLSVAENNNEIKLLENTEEEILEFLIEFYEFNFKGKSIDNTLNKKYFELRREYLIKNNQFINIEYFDKLICTISNKYLINNFKMSNFSKVKFILGIKNFNKMALIIVMNLFQTIIEILSLGLIVPIVMSFSARAN